MEVTFQNIHGLWFLLAIPLLIVMHSFTIEESKKRALKFANFEAISRITGQQIFSKNLTLLVFRTIALLIIVLATSELTLHYTGQSSNFDIVLAIDSSASMLANDLFPNRLEVAKQEAINFINQLDENANIGIVSFAGTTFIDQSLTNNQNKIKEAINNIQIKQLGGTDISEAIVTSSNLLIPSKNAKAIVLLTDGQENLGLLEDATSYAIQNSIVIYTIGIGTEEGSKLPGLETGTEAILKVNENSLILIADSTNGKFFTAKNKDELSQAYKEISASTIRRISKNLAPLLLSAALILLFIEWFLANTKFKTIP